MPFIRPSKRSIHAAKQATKKRKAQDSHADAQHPSARSKTTNNDASSTDTSTAPSPQPSPEADKPEPEADAAAGEMKEVCALLDAMRLNLANKKSPEEMSLVKLFGLCAAHTGLSKERRQRITFDGIVGVRFTFKVSELKVFHRLFWAVGSKVATVEVRISVLESLTSAVENWVALSDEEGNVLTTTVDTDHTSGRQFGSNIGKNPNVLTHTLTQRLHEHKSLLSDSLQKIHDTVLSILESDPRKCCIICEKAFGKGVVMWRATVCSAACQVRLTAWPLAVRLSPLLLDAAVLDFLLCCAVSRDSTSASYGSNPTTVFKSQANEWTLSQDETQKLVDGFPALRDGMCASELEAHDSSSASAEGTGSSGIPDRDRLKLRTAQIHRAQLLGLLASWFQGCIISAPPGLQTAWAKTHGAREFIMLNAKLARETAFVRAREGYGGRVGTRAFHGTPSPLLLSILGDALRVSGSGVFYADQPSYSVPYMRGCGLGSWAKSRFKDGYTVMFGLELTGPRKPHANGESHTRLESDLAIRQIFMIPATATKRSAYQNGWNGGKYGVQATTVTTWAPNKTQPPSARELEGKMREVCEKVKAGDVPGAVLEGTSAEERKDAEGDCIIVGSKEAR
ncbi:hypothetical protein P8C59_004454 [Phyllachora maydis]|uniref:Uncharacterized protein n=2 Tax=Phyllachora maydis TaxID=1825666 RepID=A0AAD9I2Q4_9PEZI|nr:hypothetical protein P8C59_004454 [Phyllachora maydis]